MVATGGLLTYFVVGAPDDIKLLAMLDVEPAASDDADATELPEPRRLVEVDDAPPKPENPSIADRDSSGNRRPVLVIFESHMRWYRASFAPDAAACSSPSAPAGRLDAPKLAALAEVSCRLSPWKSGQDRALETDLAICTLPATVVEAMMRIMYFDSFVLSSDEGPGLSGRR
jgi:hypothetical protein